VAEISLRDAVFGDAEAIATVHVASWQTAYRGIISDAELDSLSVPERAGQWRERLAAGVEVVVALRDEQVVGFCALRRVAGEPVEIGALYLDPALLRRGIGSRLMEEMLTRLRAAHESEVTLWVLTGNARARAFYARHGFVATGSSEQWHGADELQMRLTLASCSA
jgi:ribosomal protein S18 acetylase RimI-like enzyme